MLNIFGPLLPADQARTAEYTLTVPAPSAVAAALATVRGWEGMAAYNLYLATNGEVAAAITAHAGACAVCERTRDFLYGAADLLRVIPDYADAVGALIRKYVEEHPEFGPELRRYESA